MCREQLNLLRSGHVVLIVTNRPMVRFSFVNKRWSDGPSQPKTPRA